MKPKEHLLTNLTKKQLREVVKKLTGKNKDKTSRKKLIVILEKYSTNQIIKIINNGK